jgi:hypothetical protein
MRRILGCAVLALASVGCGDEESAKASGAPPEISTLSYQPSTVAAGQQGTISGTFAFTDPDSDASDFAIRVTSPAGQSQTLPPTPASGVSGRESGTVMFAFLLNALAGGEYGFELWMIDEAGHESNHLPGAVQAQ